VSSWLGKKGGGLNALIVETGLGGTNSDGTYAQEEHAK
jgi:hypothetical protein